MNLEPNEDDIQMVEAVIGVSRDAAIRKLKANGNDAQRAINAHYENPTSEAQQQGNDIWDESAFHTDKTSDNLPCEDPWEDIDAFQIQAPSESLGPDVFGAPSRPPSRVNHRENVDIPGEHTTGIPGESMSAAEREDEEMQRAMALSMSGLPQENGVTDNSDPHFGPATRPFYDSSQWAMTFPGTSAHEIFLNPEPVDRKRDDNEPCFLKPSTSQPYLSSLLTIMHAIPLAREALLLRGHTLSEYGHNNEWWDGNAIRMPRVVDVETGLENGDWDEIIYETQRLMAFLDMTERAYGSVEVIARLKSVADTNLDLAVSAYLQSWSEAAQRTDPDNDLPKLFWSVGIQRVAGELPEEAVTAPFFCLDVGVDDDIADTSQSLYDALDNIIWSEPWEEEGAVEAYLDTLGDVLTMKVSRQSLSGNGLGIRIPAVWYPDRYLESCKEQARAMRARKAEVGKMISKIELAQTKLTQINCKASSFGQSTVVDAGKLLESTVAHFEKSDAIQNGGDRDMDDLMGSGPQNSRPSGEAIAKELSKIYEGVKSKLRVLDEQKEKARASLRDLSRLLTDESEDVELKPKQRYTLRGVSTEPHITYVLHALDEDANDNTPDAVARKEQWWRICYSASESKPVSKTKVRETQVLKAAREESRSALLVYASEKAVSAEWKAPPMQLQNFVRADNLSFESELAASIANDNDKPSASPSALASPKRKAVDDLIVMGENESSDRPPPYPADEDPSTSPRIVSPPLPARPIPRHASPVRRSTRGTDGGYDAHIPTSLRSTVRPHSNKKNDNDDDDDSMLISLTDDYDDPVSAHEMEERPSLTSQGRLIAAQALRSVSPGSEAAPAPVVQGRGARRNPSSPTLSKIPEERAGRGGGRGREREVISIDDDDDDDAEEEQYDYGRGPGAGKNYTSPRHGDSDSDREMSDAGAVGSAGAVESADNAEPSSQVDFAGP
ncbi:MAG: hypothetical protein M1819_007196 [Sarea resinae]|nr:MAG: hypothetical protein M1819_007196 [Sarea resinae]